MIILYTKSYSLNIYSTINNHSTHDIIISQIVAKMNTLSPLTVGHFYISLPISIVIYLHSQQPYYNLYSIFIKFFLFSMISVYSDPKYLLTIISYIIPTDRRFHISTLYILYHAHLPQFGLFPILMLQNSFSLFFLALFSERFSSFTFLRLTSSPIFSQLKSSCLS